MSDAAPINPYEPPQQPGKVAEALPEGYGGFWRDQDFLVVDTRFPNGLPPRCVLTGVDIEEGERVRLRIYFQGTTSESSIEHYWPVAHNARPTRQTGNYIGWGLVLLGASLVIGDFISTIGPYVGLSFKLPAPLTYMGVGLVAGGIAALKFWPWHPLFLHRRSGNFAWVKGVHPDFLKDLPPWPGLPHE